ncbi:MAG: glycosyltransferase family 4 protein [Candidatus Eremiobacteraeota bacterium]|nr:glycosyltransferase family 4 protein [Candidatus Eremiobacteraeota bacterium]
MLQKTASPLHVGIDAWNLPGDRRGIGRYLRALIREFNERFSTRIRMTLVIPEWHTWISSKRYRDEIQKLALPVRSRRFSRKCGFDLMWFPFNGPSWEPFPQPSVATLHDASPFVVAGPDPGLRDTFLRAARECDAVITDSRFSKLQLLQHLTFAGSIDVVHLGVSKPLPPHTIAPPDFGNFVLFVGETEARKGLPLLIDSIKNVRAAGVDVSLVQVGRVTASLPQTTVPFHSLGHVDDEMLAQLYRSCFAFAYPSSYEGFGLPVLEAMSYGAPVIASDAAAIPEAGGDAALYFESGNADALTAAILKLSRDPALRETLKRAGNERAAQQTWTRAAEQTLAVFERVAGIAAVPARTGG